MTSRLERIQARLIAARAVLNANAPHRDSPKIQEPLSAAQDAIDAALEHCRQFGPDAAIVEENWLRLARASVERLWREVCATTTPVQPVEDMTRLDARLAVSQLRGALSADV